jgi:hypothetical protein
LTWCRQMCRKSRTHVADRVTSTTHQLPGWQLREGWCTRYAAWRQSWGKLSAPGEHGSQPWCYTLCHH